jgi:AcrR family transcriptional regulator
MTTPIIHFCGVLAQRKQDASLNKGERTRAAIRWAAATLLEDAGYATLSLDTIAKQAGISRPAVYQYFQNKRDCVFDVMDEFLNAVFMFVESGERPQAAGETTLLDSVVAINRRYIAFYRENAALIERVRELRQEIPELIAVQQNVNQQWAERLAKHFSKHTGMPAKSALLTAYALESMVDDFLRELFVLKNVHIAALKLNDEALAQELSAVWCRAAYGSTRAS